jgi:hypothetical protein
MTVPYDDNLISLSSNDRHRLDSIQRDSVSVYFCRALIWAILQMTEISDA